MSRYPLDLRGAFAKLDRAVQHIRTLEKEVAAFRAANPVTTLVEWEGGATFLVKVRVSETPDLRWGVLLGDAIHNLRCSLDHAVWELVQRNVRAGFRPRPTESQEKAIQFPIAHTRSAFESAPLMRFLTQGQITFLRWRQPYRRPWPEATPFSELGWLSNTDKHRIVHGAHTALESWDDFKLHCKSNMSAGRIMASEALVGAGDRLEDGAAIVRLTYEVPAGWREATGKEPWVEVRGEFKSELRFGEGRPLPSGELSRLHALIFQRMKTLDTRLG